MARATVEPGDVVAQKYRVERVIGKGGMGLVVAAVHVELGHRVALKFLLGSALDNKEAVSRFEREARAVVTLHSDHVSRVLDIGRMPDGAPYIVMELLDGMDLAHELHRRGGRLPLAEAVGYIVQACDAIAEAHALGIVHRDIKPSNLFLAKRPKKDPIVKVLDFGISKPTTLTEAPSELTGTADLIGSPLYMSPEQLRAPKTVDGRSDVWSLAATLYELVCGVPPFDGATMAELSARILTAPTPDLREHLPLAPDGFPEVMNRALEKDPSARFESVEDFARALGPFADAKSAGGIATSGASAPALTPPRVQHTLPLLPAPNALPSNPKAVSDVGVSYPPPAAAPTRGLVPRVAVALLAIGAIGVAFYLRAPQSKDTPKEAALVASEAPPPTPPPPPTPAPVASTPAALPAIPPATSVALAESATARAPVRPAPAVVRDASVVASSSTAAPAASASAAPTSSTSFDLKLIK
jgi:serine/threonine-protein kinase